MKKAILFTITTALCGVCVVLVAKEAVSREDARMDTVREYNCENYGDAINQHVGNDVCAPTING